MAEYGRITRDTDLSGHIVEGFFMITHDLADKKYADELPPNKNLLIRDMVSMPLDADDVERYSAEDLKDKIAVKSLGDMLDFLNKAKNDSRKSRTALLGVLGFIQRTLDDKLQESADIYDVLGTEASAETVNNKDEAVDQEVRDEIQRLRNELEAAARSEIETRKGRPR